LAKSIDRHEVQHLLLQGAQLIEVMPADEYAEAHIVGAANIPLPTLDKASTSQLDKNSPVIVYCHDHQ
jgi:phage shock protein E